MTRKPGFHSGCVAEDESRLQRRRRNSRVQREEPFRAAARAASRAADELVDRGFERERSRLDFLAQRVPRVKAVLARDGRLRVVQREIGGGDRLQRLACERRQRSRIDAVPPGRAPLRHRAATSLASSVVRDSDGQGARGSAYNLHAQPCGSQTGGTAVSADGRAAMTVGLALRANPLAPFARHDHGSPGVRGVNDVAVLSTGAICDKMIR